MTKTKTLEAINAILKKHNIVDETIVQDFNEVFAPKKAVAEFPPILDEDGNVVKVYCNWHKTYEDVKEFATSSKNKSGYHRHCKVAMANWRKYDKLIKELEKEVKDAMELVLDDKLDLLEAKELKVTNEAKINQLKEDRENKVSIIMYTEEVETETEEVEEVEEKPKKRSRKKKETKED